jgi:hypothetical protein
MAEFNIRSESVDVEQIMRQIRARIREKRGVDYTEEEIRELAAVKLEKFLDPKAIRSDLLEQFKRRPPEPSPPNYAFEDITIYDSHRAILRWIRTLLRPVLKLFFNPGPIVQALHIQSRLNTQQAERNTQRDGLDTLYYELVHNLVVEITRLGIEVKNLRMRVESISSRLDFDERRARALEGVVQYKPGAVPPAPLPPQAGGGPEAGGGQAEGAPGDRRARRRRRRGRRRPGQAGPPAAGEGGGPGVVVAEGSANMSSPPEEAGPSGQGEPDDDPDGGAGSDEQ